MEFTTVKTFEYKGLQCEIVSVTQTGRELSHNGYVTIPKDNKYYHTSCGDIINNITTITFNVLGELGFDTTYSPTETKSLQAVTKKTKELAEFLLLGCSKATNKK